MGCPKQYIFSPQVTPGLSSNPPSTTAPTYVLQDYMVLSYPVTSPTLTINVRNPDLDDTYNVTVESAKNVTLGNDPQFGRDSNWPIADILTFKISALYKKRTSAFTGYALSSVDEILAFFKATAGQMIKLVDHDGITWTGFVLNPDTQVVHSQEHDSSLTIIFRGVQS